MKQGCSLSCGENSTGNSWTPSHSLALLPHLPPSLQGCRALAAPETEQAALFWGAEAKVKMRQGKVSFYLGLAGKGLPGNTMQKPWWAQWRAGWEASPKSKVLSNLCISGKSNREKFHMVFSSGRKDLIVKGRVWSHMCISQCWGLPSATGKWYSCSCQKCRLSPCSPPAHYCRQQGLFSMGSL